MLSLRIRMTGRAGRLSVVVVMMGLSLPMAIAIAIGILAVGSVTSGRGCRG